MQRLKSVFLVAILGACLTVFYTNSFAANPLKKFSGFFSSESVEADPQKEYLLDETKGPWMIYVKAYDGETARQDANALVLELRKRYNLKAYVHHTDFNYSAETESEENQREVMAKMQLQQFLAQNNLQGTEVVMPPPKKKVTKKVTTFVNGNRTQEYAVLVGDFQSLDEDNIEKTMEFLKTCQPQCIMTQLKRDSDNVEKNTKDKTLVVDVVRNLYRMDDKHGNQNARPLSCVFKCTNPILPTSYFANGVDDFVVKFNSGSPYNLLRCPGKYTLKVASFTGSQFSHPNDVNHPEKIERFGEKTGELKNAEINAEIICKFLRDKGYEAYSYHDRTSSIVTVGCFESLGKMDREGNVAEFSRDIEKIINVFSPDSELVKQSRIGRYLMPYPEPIEVPRPRTGIVKVKM
ncbi:MAG: hypothetical protein LBJ67_15345 [Planctomycetaceae bacterium]|jgi:cell division septation protein DedD|nr:hypothetical protein [Planctomycetaceae bacterium]